MTRIAQAARVLAAANRDAAHVWPDAQTTPKHTIYRGWQVYQDPAPLWEGARWIGCSDRFETCVSAASMGEVFAEIDDVEDENACL